VAGETLDAHCSKLLILEYLDIISGKLDWREVIINSLVNKLNKQYIANKIVMKRAGYIKYRVTLGIK